MDPYRVLGVSRDARTSEIESAYRLRRQKYDPQVAWEEWELVQLQEAYEQIMRERGLSPDRGQDQEQTAEQIPQEPERLRLEEDHGEPARPKSPSSVEAFVWTYSGIIGGAFVGAIIGAIAASSMGGSSIVGGMIGIVVGALAGNLGGESSPPRH